MCDERFRQPEQLAGREVSIRSDLQSLGLILHEMFNGKRAFEVPRRRHAADSEGWRSAFRTDGDHHSEVMPISVPN